VNIPGFNSIRPEYEYFTAREIAKKNDYSEIADLIDEYEKNSAKVRAALRKELKLNVRCAAQLLSNVVLLSDAYLKFKDQEELSQQILFYRILLQLPLELQTRICNITFDHNSFFINSTDFESALKKTMKAFSKSK